MAFSVPVIPTVRLGKRQADPLSVERSGVRICLYLLHRPPRRVGSSAQVGVLSPIKRELTIASRDLLRCSTTLSRDATFWTAL